MFLLFSLFWSLSLLITLVMVQFFCSKNPDNYFAYCLGRFLLNLFSFVILIKYADILFMNTDTLIHVIEKKAYLICIHEKNTCILTILNDMPGKKVKQLAKKFDCD